MSDDIVVNLRGGTYPLIAPVTFVTSDSGTNGHQVVYQAYNGEAPVISGGKAITGWTAAANGEHKAPVSTLNLRQLYVNNDAGVTTTPCWRRTSMSRRTWAAAPQSSSPSTRPPPR